MFTPISAGHWGTRCYRPQKWDSVSSIFLPKHQTMWTGIWDLDWWDHLCNYIQPPCLFWQRICRRGFSSLLKWQVGVAAEGGNADSLSVTNTPAWAVCLNTHICLFIPKPPFLIRLLFQQKQLSWLGKKDNFLRVYQLGMNWPGALKRKKNKEMLVGSVGETTQPTGSIRSCVAISAVPVIHAACHPSISG